MAKKRRAGSSKAAAIRAARLLEGQPHRGRPHRDTLAEPDGPAAGQKMPDPPEGCHTDIVAVAGGSPVLNVPGSLLYQLSVAAREAKLPLQLTESQEANIDLHATHSLKDLSRITDGHDVDFVRCRALVFRKQRPSYRPWEAFIDLPTRHIGMVIAAGELRPGTGTGVETIKLRWPKPVWAGSFSFSHAWDDAAKNIARGITPLGETDGGVKLLDAVSMSCVETILTLGRAHLVRVEPEQVNVLPEWDDLADAWEYASEAALPFEDIYFDFEGPGRFAPVLHVNMPAIDLYESGFYVDESRSIGEGHVHLRGAHVYRDGLGYLVVNPYCGIDYTGGEHKTYAPEACASLGHVVFGSHRIEPIGAFTSTIVDHDGADKYVAESAFISTEPLYGHPGYVSVHKAADEDATEALGTISVSRFIMAAALRVLAALSIMETDAVVVDEATMEKRVRDRATKRGWKIADMVFIRPTRKGPRSEPTGDEAHYSHRFWVSGHYKHFGLHTRVAQNRPDLVRPCTRIGEASCGSCRRIWTQPFIKGPDDRPLVVKSLVRRRPA